VDALSAARYGHILGDVPSVDGASDVLYSDGAVASIAPMSANLRWEAAVSLMYGSSRGLRQPKGHP
jgi:hypothetical protein